MSLVFLLSRPLSKMITVQSLCVSLVGKNLHTSDGKPYKRPNRHNSYSSAATSPEQGKRF